MSITDKITATIDYKTQTTIGGGMTRFTTSCGVDKGVKSDSISGDGDSVLHPVPANSAEPLSIGFKYKFDDISDGVIIAQSGAGAVKCWTAYLLDGSLRIQFHSNDNTDRVISTTSLASLGIITGVEYILMPVINNNIIKLFMSTAGAIPVEKTVNGIVVSGTGWDGSPVAPAVFTTFEQVGGSGLGITGGSLYNQADFGDGFEWDLNDAIDYVDYVNNCYVDPTPSGPTAEQLQIAAYYSRSSPMVGA